MAFLLDRFWILHFSVFMKRKAGFSVESGDTPYLPGLDSKNGAEDFMVDCFFCVDRAGLMLGLTHRYSYLNT